MGKELLLRQDGSDGTHRFPLLEGNMVAKFPPESLTEDQMVRTDKFTICTCCEHGGRKHAPNRFACKELLAIGHHRHR